MGDLLGSPRAAALFHFFLKSTDLSRFNCCGRRMRSELAVEKHPNQAFIPYSVKVSKNTQRACTLNETFVP